MFAPQITTSFLEIYFSPSAANLEFLKVLTSLYTLHPSCLCSTRYCLHFAMLLQFRCEEQDSFIKHTGELSSISALISDLCKCHNYLFSEWVKYMCLQPSGISDCLCKKRGLAANNFLYQLLLVHPIFKVKYFTSKNLLLHLAFKYFGSSCILTDL